MQVRYGWRGPFANGELNELHAEGFGHPVGHDDWRRQVERHSLGWVVARDKSSALVGFVNVAWDGGAHAFLLDTLVAVRSRRLGIGRALVALAADEARAAGCEWLHVDYDPELAPFYEACGFVSTPAGLIDLTSGARSSAP